ncbi:MAG: polysaccharide deacetylase family protein [Planctomycetia bacterium]|nr:polysaccharide deacetylase family protein [Candidatus Brocadia sp.]QOJ06516.1 MAG: polysaccharide deacetylase family protein [Planctomycetia bacterium]TVL95659.1 MAG: hypothetical protein CV082_10255 [Candidatus Brocadia sp. BL1]HQU30677.1 polysaccharide deacetylase family protein [Candidatus Brocadia sapporoensis]
MKVDVQSNRKFIKLKYKIAWYAGIVLSFLLYFSGIIGLYIFLRKKYFKKYIAVVLTYHRVNDNNNSPDITVSQKNFDSQIAYLIRNFNIVSIDKILDECRYRTQLEDDTIAITFDDGYKDNYTHAYPILKKYNAPFTIFVSTGYIDTTNMLTKEEIAAMHKDKITFGGHTVTHKVLSGLNREAATAEISGSKSALEQILKENVKYFAYPYGKKGRDFTNETMQIVKECGFTAAFSTKNGCIDSNGNYFALNRIGIRNVPLFVFKSRLSGIFENKFITLLRVILGL